MEASDSVQPGNEGQGADDGQGFMQDYLTNEVPEDYREHVEPYLRNIESNANEKFREHAEYRKRYEPYDNLNLTDYEPEGLQNLLAFAELMENEDAFKEWWTEAGNRMGFMDELSGGEEEVDEYDEGDFEGLTLDDVKGAISELLDEKVGPLEERLNGADQQRAADEANDAIETKMNELHEKHGDFDEQTVYKLAFALSDSTDDPIQAGFDEYMRLVSNIEQQTVNGKHETPAPPEAGGGQADTNQSPPSSFADASKMARERLAQLR